MTRAQGGCALASTSAKFSALLLHERTPRMVQGQELHGAMGLLSAAVADIHKRRNQQAQGFERI